MADEGGSTTAQRHGNATAAQRERVRLLVDGYFIDRSYGFGRYVRELVHAIERYAADIELVVLVPPRGEATARALVTRGRVVVEKQAFFPWWEQWTVPRTARAQRCDLVHFPYQTMALSWPRQASVLTLHDMIPFRGDDLTDWSMPRLAGRYRRWILKRVASRVGQVVSVSSLTQDELRRILGVESIVAPCTVDHFIERHADATPPPPDRPYFLHRGDAGPHKNTRRVVEAFVALRREHPGVVLKVFALSASEPLARELAGDGVEFLGRVSEAELAGLYQQALAVLMPSLEEGFGLSLIEAFGFGAPVVTSNRRPMSDIAAHGSARLVDPLSVVQIERAMRELLQDDGVRTRLREAGMRRKQAFSGPTVAATLRAIYQRLACPGPTALSASTAP